MLSFGQQFFFVVCLFVDYMSIKFALFSGESHMLHSAHRYEGSFSVFFFIYVYYRIKVSIVEKVEKFLFLLEIK